VKRGIAYDLADEKDFEALSPGVSWWYDWSSTPAGSTSTARRSQFGMDFIPTLWNGNFNDAQIEQLLLADPQIRYLLVLNEPNLTDQANLSPQAAANLWPRIEAIARHTGVKIVGPQITWGTMPGYQDPVVWLNAFYASYRSANGGMDPTIDYLGFHWYDYGLGGQLDRLIQYGKPFWVTEFANWHNGDGAAQIDTAAKQAAQMTEMVAVCEGRADVFRYAWFTGRLGSNDTDVHFTSLLKGPGALSDLGAHYIILPF
jgi:putative glycosyl hydrolase